MINVHDYNVDSYFIDFTKKTVTFNISLDKKKKAILFKNIFCYHFCDELPGSILLDLEEKSVSKFFIHNKKFLEEKKEDAWPILYDSLEELKELIQNKNFNYYMMSSSYGLNGWVLAEGVEIV